MSVGRYSLARAAGAYRCTVGAGHDAWLRTHGSLRESSRKYIQALVRRAYGIDERGAVMMGAAIGIALGFLIGVGCRWFDLPLPAPPKIVGALLVVFMTLGFVGTDYVLLDIATQ